MDKVEINEPTAGEGGNITLEQQSAMQDAAAENNGEQPTTDRPDWLNEKFESPQDLQKAYDELSTKLGQNEETSNQTEESSENSPQSSAISSASDEYAEKGELSEDTYGELAKVGITKDMVDTYIAGQESAISTESIAIQDSIGGEESYKAMIEWASENLSEAEQNAYDEVVESGSVDAAKLAVQGLFSRFQSSGKAPNLMQGQAQGSGVVPFNSVAQVREAMSDKRYSQDPAYRKQVEQRIAISNVL